MYIFSLLFSFLLFPFLFENGLHMGSKLNTRVVFSLGAQSVKQDLGRITYAPRTRSDNGERLPASFTYYIPFI